MRGAGFIVRPPPKSHRPRPHLRVDGCDHCDRKPAPHTCLWWPVDQQSVGAPPNMLRAVVYRLCRTCAHRRTPEMIDRVERRLLAEFFVRLQQPGRN
jgi:hypothetical protein